MKEPTVEDVPTTIQRSALSTNPSMVRNRGIRSPNHTTAGRRSPLQPGRVQRGSSSSGIFVSFSSGFSNLSSVPPSAGQMGEFKFVSRWWHWVHFVSATAPCISRIFPRADFGSEEALAALRLRPSTFWVIMSKDTELGATVSRFCGIESQASASWAAFGTALNALWSS